MGALVAGRLADRIALVTGAANGIGRASALRLAREGAHLAVVDREGEALHAVGRAIEGLGRQALAITADWTDAAVVREAFAAPVTTAIRPESRPSTIGAIAQPFRRRAVRRSGESRPSARRRQARAR